MNQTRASFTLDNMSLPDLWAIIVLRKRVFWVAFATTIAASILVAAFSATMISSKLLIQVGSVGQLGENGLHSAPEPFQDPVLLAELLRQRIQGKTFTSEDGASAVVRNIELAKSNTIIISFDGQTTKALDSAMNQVTDTVKTEHDSLYNGIFKRRQEAVTGARGRLANLQQQLSYLDSQQAAIAKNGAISGLLLVAQRSSLADQITKKQEQLFRAEESLDVLFLKPTKYFPTLANADKSRRRPLIIALVGLFLATFTGAAAATWYEVTRRVH